jgi:hypothetical protein
VVKTTRELNLLVNIKEKVIIIILLVFERKEQHVIQ